MSKENPTETEKILLEMAGAILANGKYGKAYTAKQIGDLVASAVRSQAPGSTAAVEVNIAYPKATVKGTVNLTEPNVTLHLDEIELENDPTPNTTRVKLTKPVVFREEVRETNKLKVAAYNAVKVLMMGAINDPQKLIAIGMQMGLDGLQQNVQITGIALKIQPNGSFGAIVSGKPKK